MPRFPRGFDPNGLFRLIPADRRPRIRRGPGTLYRRFASLRFLGGRDRGAALRFLVLDPPPLPLPARVEMLRRFVHITNQVRAYHTQAELLEVAQAILRCPSPVTVVEAGAGSGASTAKLSLAVRAAGGGVLHVFDSFRGLPENDEVHAHQDGRPIRFRRGAFRGRLSAVQRTVEAHGAPEVCVYHRCWFEETLPGFEARIDVALLDVDLWSSTRTCLVHLFPHLAPGGVLFSQDGHLRTITDRLADPGFWQEDVGIPPPRIDGLGVAKLLRMRPAVAEARGEGPRPSFPG